MSFEDAELLKEFVVESQEHLSDVENQLLTLESQGDNMDVALVNTVFRAVHSIKGAAGFLGLDTLQGLAHREEEVLNRLRSHELRPTSLVVNTLLKATDRLKGLLDDIDNSNGQDVSEHLVALERILSGECNGPVTPTVAPAAPPAAPALESLSSEAMREFLIESYDNLEQLERDLMTLERSSQSTEIINSAFRSIHTIKGTAGFLGFGKLEKLTHVAETLLGNVRSGSIEMSSDICGGLFQMIDAVRAILSQIESNQTEGKDDFLSLVAVLSQLSDTGNSKSKKTAAKKAPSAPRPSKKKEATAKKPSDKQAEIESSESLDAPKQGVNAVESTAANTAVQPTSKAATTDDQSTAGRGPEQSPATVHKPTVATPTSAAVAPAQPVPAEMIAAQAARSTAKDSEASAADSTIRVDVALLDKLMTCVGELVLARNQILQFTNGNVDGELHSTSQRLNIITTELQESVMKTRMQPIGNVWSKFPRLVRDLAAICEKQVRIEMEGKETELDKTIIEAIKDPLTHLVRNTVDHGIERPEVRVQKGKPAEGCLTLRAYHEGGQVNIEICDDGAGLNYERIKAKAIERGLMAAEQVARMADRDVGNLIFLPGFSTAEKVSNVSGRGVGMDVVKTNIEKIGGTVDLAKPGWLGHDHQNQDSFDARHHSSVDCFERWQSLCDSSSESSRVGAARWRASQNWH